MLVISVTCMRYRPLHYGKEMVYHDRVYIFIQLMYNKNDHFANQSIFVRCWMSSLASIAPFSPRPKTPFTYVVYFYSDMSLSKGHLGSRGGEHPKQTERHQFHLSNDKRHNFKYILYACAGRIL